MKYIVKTIEGSKEVEGKFGTQIRTTFTVEGNDNKLSCFSKFPLTVGQEVDGNIVQNGEWWNFKFTPKTFETKPSPTFQPQPDQLRMERKVDAVMTEIQMIRGVLGEILQKVSPILNNDDPF